MMSFKEQIIQGIPSQLPSIKMVNRNSNSAPKRKDILNQEEKKLALKNALRYFPKEWHIELAKEFLLELNEYGRIYMYRFKPDYEIYARSINDYPSINREAASIMLMIQNN